jgi:hypothetical protein
MFWPSLTGFENGAMTCRIIKLNRMAISITIKNEKQHTLQPAYGCPVFIVVLYFTQVYEALTMAPQHAGY